MFTVNQPLLRTFLSQRYGRRTVDRITEIIVHRLSENEAWVVITEDDFKNAVGYIIIQGDNEYHCGNNIYRSKPIKDGKHMFFRKYYSNGKGPIKGWFKRIVFELKKEFGYQTEELNFIYSAINDQIEDRNVEVKARSKTIIVHQHKPIQAPRYF